MEYGMILVGISIFVFAIIDISGCTFHLQKRYRENARIRASRKKVGVMSIVFGASGILYSFQMDIRSVQANVIAAICIGTFLIRTFYVRNIMNIVEKEEKEETEEKE